MRKVRLASVIALSISMAVGLLGLIGCAPSIILQAPAGASGASGSAGSATVTTTASQIRTVALKGPTAMGMVKLMNQADNGELTSYDYSFNIVAAIDEVPPMLVKGDVDIAAIPANLASVLYNNTSGQIQVLAINTLGVLYLVEDQQHIQNISDLRGLTVYASGKGATPEYALNSLLLKDGLTPGVDVNIEWLPEHAAVVAALAQNPAGIALLPQPFVTTAQNQNPNLRIGVDLNEQWNKLNPDSALLTGVLVARKAFVDENPQAVADFLEHYAQSVSYVNDNLDAAAALIGAYDIVPEAVAKKAIPFCNIVCITGTELKTQLSGYLQVLYNQNPQSVGGTLPPSDFYYLG